MSDAGQSDRNLITSLRGSKNIVDPYKPYAWMVEKERAPSGAIEDTGIIFLTNRECQFRCLMCDLWRNTTDDRVPPGAITRQIEWALERMPGVRHLKLYNSGSFFDEMAIAEREYKNIAGLISSFESVIVECHPNLVDEKCLRFRDMIKPVLNIALGLETINREVLGKLNKKMTPEDFLSSVNYLTANEIQTRAFILLRPPYMTEKEGIMWAQKSIDFAFDAGVECCIVIPVRGGNGVMEKLAGEGHFSPPEIESLEKVLEYGIRLRRGRVFADTWDMELFSSCSKCFSERSQRVTEMNITQMPVPEIRCSCRQITC